jgi:nucleoside-diphosphate-sugar epimerase
LFISDAVRGLLTVLFKGKLGEAYNIVNPAASVMIRERAELVANEICGGKNQSRRQQIEVRVG